MKNPILTTVLVLPLSLVLQAQNCEDACGKYLGSAYQEPGPNPCEYMVGMEPGTNKKVAEWECCCKKYRKKLEKQERQQEASLDNFTENLEKDVSTTKRDNSKSYLKKIVENEASKINHKDEAVEKYLSQIEGDKASTVPENATIVKPKLQTIQNTPYEELKRRTVPPNRLGRYITKQTSSSSRGCNEVQKTLILRQDEVEWIDICDTERNVGKWKYIPNRNGAMVDAEGNIWMESLTNRAQARIEFRGQNIWIHGYDNYIYYKQ